MRLLLSIFLLIASASSAAEWSEPVVVEHQFKPAVTYRARVEGSYLVVRADIEEGWHTFSMDNDLRATEALAGKPSLGVDAPTQITLEDGLEATGGWSQTEPKDFSKPELRWYSWGYEEPALFVTNVATAGTGEAKIGIRGQACTETTCKNVDVELALALGGPSGTPADIDLTHLIPVREK